MSLAIAGLGFISSNIALEALGEGYNVCIVARTHSVAARKRLADMLRGRGVKIIHHGSLGVDAVRSSLRTCRPEALVYTIGVMAGGEKAWRAHVDVWRVFLDALRGVGVETVVYISAAVVAPCRSGPLSERDTPPWEAYRYSSYASSKAEGEMLALKYYREAGVPVAIARPVIVYGPYAGHVEHRVIRLLASHGYSLGVDVDTVPVKDVARATLFLHERRVRGEWVIVARRERFTLRDLGCQVALKTRGRCRVVSTPIRLLARLGSMAGDERLKTLYTWLKCGWSFKPQRLVELGYKWSVLEETVDEYTEWLYRGSIS